MKRVAAFCFLFAVLGACSEAPSSTPSPSASSSVTQASPGPSPTPRPEPDLEPEPGRVARAVSVDHGPRSKKLVALTFDADMTEGMLAQLRSGEVKSWNNEAVTRELRRTDTPATHFITGLWAQAYPKEVRNFARDPSIEIASHSWDHLSWTPNCYGLPAVRSVRQKRAEVRDTAAILKRLAGEEPFFFRFPGGCHTKADLRIVADLGEQAVGWDVVSGDAFGTDADAVADAVIDQVRPGSIVVMHLHGGPNSPTTAPALRRIIPELKDKGYRFVTLSELLG